MPLKLGGLAASSYCKNNDLASVATTGSYNNLNDKPSIAYSSEIAADDFSQAEVNNLKSNKLADGAHPGQIIQFMFREYQVFQALQRLEITPVDNE